MVLRGLTVSLVLWLSIVLGLGGHLAYGQQKTIVLQNGMAIGPGFIGEISSFDVSKGEAIKAANETQGRNIIVVDDELRKTFFHRRMGSQPIDQVVPVPRIELNNAKRRVERGNSVAGITWPGRPAGPFDKFGRRLYLLETASKTYEILQGITEVTPHAIHVESLNIDNAPAWDMRLSFNAVPQPLMLNILLTDADRSQESDWLEIINLLIAAKRYSDAAEVLEMAIKEKPEMTVHSAEFARLEQAVADQLFDEVQLRRKAGQFRFADAIMRGFDTKKLSDETKLKIEKRLQQNLDETEKHHSLITGLRKQLESLNDPDIVQSLMPIMEEIEAHFSLNTLDRFADYERLKDDGSMSLEQRVAIGMSGWLLGNASGLDNPKIVRSIIDARPLVVEYLQSTDRGKRQDLLERLRKLEAGVPRYIAPLVARMNPVFSLPKPVEGNPDRFLIDVPLGSKVGDELGAYWLQLPPEYDPFRQYPCVVTLNGETSSELDQLKWWSGEYHPDFGISLGEASRNGYIVISPRWRRSDQIRYEGTENEHHRVLACLRDAMRRANIDSDRVFLSGHHMGAEAAWDMALAHPDMWAGMVIIGGMHNRYVTFYRPNSRYVPSYFVIGEFDGAPAPLARIGKEIDEYVRIPNSDFMFVMYSGRGRDHFQEELPRIVDWMNLASHRRRPPPEDIEVRSARFGDNFFWWLEVDEFQPGMMNHPLLEFDPKRVVDIQVSRKSTTNFFSIQTLAASRFTLWLSPAIVNFDRGDKLTVSNKGKKSAFDLKADLEVLLEDVRTRADRKRPFWARITFD